jgi:hypothetical protein
MKKVIYFYDDKIVKKHGGMDGLKKYARSNRYLLRDTDLSTVEGHIEEADEYKGALPKHYEDHLSQAAEEPADKPKGSDESKGTAPLDPTA